MIVNRSARSPFRIGDQIVTGTNEGTVGEIQTRATFIRTCEGRRVGVRNADLFTDTVVVNTAFEHRRPDQTEASHGDRTRQREGWPVDRARASVSRKIADPIRGAAGPKPRTGQRQ